MMGCYGIGISRIIAASIEQNHDEQGIIWATSSTGESIAPFMVVIIPMRSKDGSAEQKAEELYHSLQQQGVNVLLDDRDERPGVKFADMELIGIPHRVVVSERNLANNQYEYKSRTTDSAELLSLEALIAKLTTK